MKIIELKEALIRIEYPRRTDRGNIRHKLEDIIIIIIIELCTMIGNGEDFEDMEDFGKEREA